MTELIFFLLLLVVIKVNPIYCIVGGIQSAPPPPDDPVVFVHLYTRNARLEGLRNNNTGLYSFLGIHYADTPTGPNRFLRPQYKRLQGDINATLYGSPCPQPDPQDNYKIIGNEDCLLLNVYTPQMPDESTGLPVIVWIHGGGFRYGSASQYGPDPLTNKRVIFVPVQYRLGVLGVLGVGTKDFSGNVALFDIAAAVRWVQEYISFFGGDNKNIKIMGQGSGAASAMYLSQSKISRDAISGVIAMSGTPISQYALDKEPVQSIEEIAKIHNCSNKDPTEILQCLQKKDIEEIVKKDDLIQTERLQGRAMVKSMTGHVEFNPVVEVPDDDRGLPGFITSNPDENLKSGDHAKVPLLIGTTKDETANGFVLQEIQKVFKTADVFLNNLSKSIGLDLSGFISISNITGEILPNTLGVLGLPSLSDYLKIPPQYSPEQIISKITEATTDALFNLPVFLTADNWGKTAPSFLYSFEYVGSDPSKGIQFLQGLPLVSKSKGNKDKIGHGDELIYLFDAFDIFGKPIPNANFKNAKDNKVRDNFTNLIAKFAGLKNDSVPKNDNLFSTFSTKGSPFIKISDDIKLDKNFRFCQLSLWGASIESQPAISCESLFNQLVAVDKITGTLTGTLGLSGTGKQPTKPIGGGGLLGLL